MKFGDVKIDLSKMETDDVFLLARRANVEVYERALPVAQKVARAYCRRYDWISVDDLVQDLMFEIPRVMYGFREDNAAGNNWSKYLYFKLGFKAKDILRREDPLGISHPQKKAYPQWHRLGDESLSGFDPKDHRSDVELPEEMVEDIANWKEYFTGLRPMREIKHGRSWDKVRQRVRFRRQKVTLADWYRARKIPKQMLMNWE